MIIKGSGERDIFALFPILTEELAGFQFIVVGVDFFFFTVVNYQTKEVPFYSKFTDNLYHRWVFYLSSKYVIK